MKLQEMKLIKYFNSCGKIQRINVTGFMLRETIALIRYFLKAPDVTVNININVFWDVTPWSLLPLCQTTRIAFQKNIIPMYERRVL
jgi:hypothetical protein